MNKKIIVLIIAIILLAILGGIAFWLTNNNQESANNGGNEIENNTLNTQTNDNNTNATNIADTENSNENIETTPNADKVLVLYFSQSGNTEAVANFIHDAVGGDIVKLETETPYPSDYDELVDYAQEEQRENARPALSTNIDNIDEYDTIFLGYPNWWGDMPMPIYTFLDEYDLSGKTIAPFITHGGSGLSGTPENIKEEEPNATVTEGLAVSGSSSRNAQSTVNNWLSQIGF